MKSLKSTKNALKAKELKWVLRTKIVSVTCTTVVPMGRDTSMNQALKLIKRDNRLNFR